MSDPLDYRGKRLDDVDFAEARLHSANFEGARITDGWLRNADISGYIDGLRVNGVEVGPLVQAELDRRFPERVKLRATDPEGLAKAWEFIDELWGTTVQRARTMPEAQLFVRVDDEWSFVETLRHLILATDAWFYRMVRSEPRPYHPWGLAGSFLTDPAALGLDYNAKPSLDQVLSVRRERMDTVKDAVALLTVEDLDRVCIPPSTPGFPDEPHSLLKCLHVILDEEWEHNRYANRDLDILATGTDRRTPPPGRPS